MNYLDIKLPASDDNTYSLHDFNGQKVVLYFYPKDNTSGCTLEAKDFTCLQQEYKAKGYTILGVSRAAMKPIWDGDGFQPRLMLPLSLSYDHRVIDGADGVRFTTYLSALLGDIRRLLL